MFGYPLPITIKGVTDKATTSILLKIIITFHFERLASLISITKIKAALFITIVICEKKLKHIWVRLDLAIESQQVVNQLTREKYNKKPYKSISKYQI